MSALLWAVVAVCLAGACIMDCRTCQVYNFFWWISGAAAGILLLMRKEQVGVEEVAELGIFILVQCTFFAKMYGRADCYAFSVCAAAEAAAGIGGIGFLAHMLGAFCLLALVQGIRRNIDSRGNLKRPVPFLPYITLAFWALLWYHYTC